MGVVNGSDLYMWIAGDLVAYSTSYTISIDMETRPGTNKGSGTWRKALPGMLNISGTCDGLYVYVGGWALLANKIVERSPVRLQFGPKDPVSGLVDEDVEYISGDFLITFIKLNATDAENATYTASFTYYDNFGTTAGTTPPTVTTNAVTLIFETSARTGGNVTSDGGALVTARGVCYNTTGMPTLANFYTSNGTGTGTFISDLSGLVPNTPYYVRAYATNYEGTSYGPQQAFTTAVELIPTYYWVAINGSDAVGDGSYGRPWLTLAYAVTQVSTGETINIKSGTYNIATQLTLPEGVSLKGQGMTNTILRATTALSPMISMLSLAEGTDGNQSISYLMLDGDLIAQQALYSRGRINIKLHHITVVDFLGTTRNVVRIDGRVAGAGEPTTWATGIEIYDCAFTNNGAAFVYSPNVYFAWAAVELMGTSGALVHDNVFNNQTGGRYGYCLKCINGYIRGAKIYDNEFYTNVRDQNGVTSYSFCIELWNGKGGVDIYDNYCNGGGIDLAGRGWEDPYSYGYAARVHHNTLILNAQPTYRSTAALLFESGSDDGVYFYKNYVKNFTHGVTFSMRNDADAFVVNIDGFYIYYNIFENLGKNNSTQAGYGITNSIVNVTKDTGSEVTFDATVNDFVVANNVIYHSVLTAFGLYLTATDSVSGHGATWTNVLVVNNIFGIMYWPCQWKDQTLDYVTVKENIFHDAEDTTMFNNCTVTNDDVEAGVDDNPDFIGGAPFNFHLQAGSPAINAGVATGQAFITTDYDDEAIANPPEIGAYEF